METVRAFVMDDTPTNRVILDLVLQATGGEIRCVADGESAVVAIGRQRAELVLLHLRGPHGDGPMSAASSRPARSRGDVGVLDLIREVIVETRRDGRAPRLLAS